MREALVLGSRERRMPLRLIHSHEKDGFTEGEIQINGLRTRYLAAGFGNPLPTILLPGALNRAEVWSHTISHLAQREHFVIAPDLPGNGFSQTPKRFDTQANIVFLEGLMDAFNLERANVVSYSQSVATAIGYARQNPDRVEKIVAVSGWALEKRLPIPMISERDLLKTVSRVAELATFMITRAPFFPQAAFGFKKAVVDHLPRPALKFLVDRLLSHNGYTTDEVLDNEIVEAIRDDNAWKTVLRWFKSEIGPHGVRSHFGNYLSEIDSPMLILHGGHDRLIPTKWAQATADQNPKVKLRIIEGVGHLLLSEAPDEVSQEIGSFLNPA